MDRKLILNQYNFGRGYLDLLINDIPDDRMAEQPGQVINHPAWHLGHLIFTTDNFLKIIGGESNVPANYKDLFGAGTTPTSDRSKYPSKTELISQLDDRRKLLASSFEKAPAEVLSNPNPFARALSVMPTVGHFVVFGMLQHEFGHLNQIATWRAAAGMVQALSKLPV